MLPYIPKGPRQQPASLLGPPDPKYRHPIRPRRIPSTHRHDRDFMPRRCHRRRQFPQQLARRSSHRWIDAIDKQKTGHVQSLQNQTIWIHHAMAARSSLLAISQHLI
jgi:hypothetical protein